MCRDCLELNELARNWVGWDRWNGIEENETQAGLRNWTILNSVWLTWIELDWVPIDYYCDKRYSLRHTYLHLTFLRVFVWFIYDICLPILISYCRGFSATVETGSDGKPKYCQFFNFYSICCIYQFCIFLWFDPSKEVPRRALISIHSCAISDISYHNLNEVFRSKKGFFFDVFASQTM